MTHSNEIAVKILSERYYDYPANSHRYDRDYDMLIKAIEESQNLSDEKISGVIYELDQYAENFNFQEFGLPTHNEHLMNEMREIVRNQLNPKP